ncbi:MAG: hypothetical protein K6E40_06170, partial [Desulfovibrio sp.]|nr:hypothetical protein [Desulfovibrio sp.]
GWREGERPTRENVRQAIQIWREEVGAQGLDMMWCVHGNTAHTHAHLLVCLIDPLTCRARDLGMYRVKSQKAKARILALQGGEACKDDLYLPAPAGAAVVNAVASYWQAAGLDGLDAPAPLEDPMEVALKTARELVLPALTRSKSCEEFHATLVEAGVGVRRSGSGLLFTVDGIDVPGSRISKRKCGLKALEKALKGPYVEGVATVQPAPEGADGVVKNPDAKFWRGRDPDGPETLPPLTSDAQSIEARHGVKSRQRRAQEVVPVAMERAEVAGGGWQTFHVALAETGIQVRPSGDGLVYIVGGVEVRASHVSRRKCLRPALEASFGPFEAASDAVLEQADAVATSVGPERVEDMPDELVPWWEDYMRDREAWLADEHQLTESIQVERRRFRERLKAELDAELAEAASGLRAARTLGGRRCLPRGAGAALRMALRERGAARGRALRQVLAGVMRARRRHFPDSFAAWLELQGQAALADAWRHRGIAGPQPAPAPEEPEDDFGLRPGL